VITTSALAVARSYLGTEEIEGKDSNAQIVAWLREVAPWASGDEIAWCSAFMNHIARLLGLPRPNSLRARSWLAVGKPVPLSEARPEEDVVVFARGRGKQPGPEVIDAPGHVALFVGLAPGEVIVLGGNQSDAVTIARFHQADVLGVRRLA
jgi:uncharacterized protein (TIGR02594 family)